MAQQQASPSQGASPMRAAASRRLRPPSRQCSVARRTQSAYRQRQPRTRACCTPWPLPGAATARP
eukprot:362817-Chlamydomonas_euryale.AAC.1